MLTITLTLLTLASGPVVSRAPHPFEITNNKPFLPVSVNGSAPQWFILDTGNNTTSILARECADRLKIARGEEAQADVGAGSGADVRLSQASDALSLRVFGETLSVAQPTVLTLGHVSRTEGRRIDGLLGYDFMSRHVRRDIHVEQKHYAHEIIIDFIALALTGGGVFTWSGSFKKG